MHQKTDKQSKNCLLLSKISQSNCKWLFFAVKYGAPYGGIQNSEQLCRDTIWGYLEYGASNCVRHMVSPGLDGLKYVFKRYIKFKSFNFGRTNIIQSILGSANILSKNETILWLVIEF